LITELIPLIDPVIVDDDAPGLEVTLMSSVEIIFEKFTSETIMITLRVGKWMDRKTRDGVRGLILYACLPFDFEINEAREVQIFMGKYCQIDPPDYFIRHSDRLVVTWFEYRKRWTEPRKRPEHVATTDPAKLLGAHLWFLTNPEVFPILMSLQGSFRG
jgi:hypothetical protein